MKEMLLPHYNERQTPIDMLVLHSTAFNAADAAAILNSNKLSSHYILDLDGNLYKMVEEKYRAWHTGEAFWRGIGEDLNSRSVGIEICNLSLGQTPFSEAQINKLIPFCQKLMRKYSIRPEMVVAHSDIAPTRKPDPGFAFPWKRLAKEGIGLWYQPRNAEKMPDYATKDLLKIIGYDTRSPESVQAAAYAFCRRYLPKYVKADNDVRHLVDNILPDNYDFMEEKDFLTTLKAVAYTYLNASK